MTNYGLHISTDMSREELDGILRRWEPWRYSVEFSNGVRTADLKIREPFVHDLLAKWHFMKDHIPEESLRGASVLDQGCGVGQFGLFLAREFQVRYLGVDLVEQTVEISNFLLSLCPLEGVEFVLGNAEELHGDEQFDLILNLAVINNLENPFRCVRNTYNMLKAGGQWILELLVQDLPEEGAAWHFQKSAYMGDASLWWMPTRRGIENMLEAAGFSSFEVILDWKNVEMIGEKKRKLAYVVRKQSG